MQNVDDAWESFMSDSSGFNTTEIPKYTQQIAAPISKDNIPECGKLSISTKTMISYLTSTIPLEQTFWNIKIIPYSSVSEGVIKKQMKFSATSKEKLDEIISKVEDARQHSSKPYIDNSILNHIDNPGGRIPFRSVRKISIGLCKKDITSYRCKKKSAFYNCFVVILRIKHQGAFKELHVKVFNTGKLEIPGIQTPGLLPKTLDLLVRELRSASPTLSGEQINYKNGACETVLINSNFNCGYYINRERLYEILRNKYRINSAYDPCSYPGIQCEFYYDYDSDIQTGQQTIQNNSAHNDSPAISSEENVKKKLKVSFMMFRTGSVLIVGKCCEVILDKVYTFIKQILHDEFHNINNGLITYAETCKGEFQKTSHTRNVRRRTIMVYNSSIAN